MRFLSEFRDPQAAKMLVRRIRKVADSLGEVSFMEVCGTHTMSIYRNGIRRLLPPNIRILSGPGCPVCVTPNAFLDRAIALARLPGVTIATFGDMMRVPGSTSSLEREHARGCDIRVVYSPIDALRIAAQEQRRRLVFLGVGFETTAPALAATLLEAKRTEVKNFSILSAAKVIPPAM
ncbi:MAG: hydrogenase formation protein HypD, partial [candidate division Zixibacteria bacterium]|nr:hydrogenase formation protein HypD [candidate division Zixibacteria bacterium]